MKRTRLLWAAGLMAAAVAAMVGLSTAGAALPLEQMDPPAPVFAPVQIEEAAPAAQLETVPKLQVAVRAEDLPDGMRLTFFDSGGAVVGKAVLDRRIGAACELTPGADYTVETMSGMTATFRLEINGSVTNATGAAWTDGEILHLGLEPKGTVTVLASVAGLDEEQTLRFTLTGPDYHEIRAVGREGDNTQGKVSFTGLAMGDYTLTGPDGQTREISLTLVQNAVSISLD